MWRSLAWSVAGLAVIGLGVAGLGLYGLWYFSQGLPDYQQLGTYRPPVTTRIHGGDGTLIAEMAHERRLFVPYDAIPKRVVDAFLAAEDKSFFEHAGIDPMGIARAFIDNLQNLAQEKRLVGASTITQQVAKNFLLSNEVSFKRKVREAILAVRIEKAYTKEHILELYLNEIFLGRRAYGVAAAALNYFGKGLDELTIAEAAYLAALPKAPNNYNPTLHPDRAKDRRDWVIGRMEEDRRITEAEADEAQAQPLLSRPLPDLDPPGNGYFVEEVRREMIAKLGEAALYDGGLSIRTTLDQKIQSAADEALRAGLIAYDRRHGWRGPVAHLEPGSDWAAKLGAVEIESGMENWRAAIVLGVDNSEASLGFEDGTKGRLPMAGMAWARPNLPEQLTGPPPKLPGDVVKPGDVIVVELSDEARPGSNEYLLRQIPKVNGAVVALDPHTGRVLALSGGFSFDKSQYDRVTQAKRQPGSAFKPFVYATALDNGFNPSSLILDAPVAIDQGPGLGVWKPGNYSGHFYGPTTLRAGLELSRNLMTVRLAQFVGMDKVVATARHFGVVDDIPPVLSMALGAGETTLMRLTTAYSMFVNGGRRIKPSLIDRAQDRDGRDVFLSDQRTCTGCQDVAWSGQEPPDVPDLRESVISPQTAYQIVNILQGVVDRGTATRVKAVGHPLAGKTGTSNESKDTWFVGFAPDLAVGVFVGFDQPDTLGKRETGASAAAPIFRDIMAVALAGKAPLPFRVPPGLRLVRVDPKTGLLAEPGARNVIWEAFKPGTEPLDDDRPVLDLGRVDDPGAPNLPQANQQGTTGLY
jgi:penicillin-binding protein 1A